MSRFAEIRDALAFDYYRHVGPNWRPGRINNIYVSEGQDGIRSGTWSNDRCYRETYKEETGKSSLHGYLMQLAN
jgi:hypothetical protein